MKYPILFRTVAAIVLLGDATHLVTAFHPHAKPTNACGKSLFLGRPMASSSSLQARKTQTCESTRTFDPLHLASDESSLLRPLATTTPASVPLEKEPSNPLDRAGWAAATALVPLTVGAQQAVAATVGISQGYLNPANFQPVCATSDGFYRFLQTSVRAIVGPESFVEYGPLIAGGLLRVRLELCVVESFFQEAVGPFIAQNGISWILPWHETVETFLAGAIFSLATTFILIGSTKIIMVVVTYTDVLIGLPCRIFGGFAFDRASGKPVTLDLGFGPFKKRFIGPPEPKEGEAPLGKDISKADPASLVVILLSGAVRVTGQALGVSLWQSRGNNRYTKTALLFCASLVDDFFLSSVHFFSKHTGTQLVREVLEAIDSFVGRYLVLLATFYLAIKFVHFKIFPDFP
jgi:hypothetical protein